MSITISATTTNYTPPMMTGGSAVAARGDQHSGDQPSPPVAQGVQGALPGPEDSTERASSTNDLSSDARQDSELALIRSLEARDREVRAHEQAHLAAAGSLALSGAHFTFQKGPDGKQYTIGGEVSVDTSPVPGDLQATLEKARQIRAAALAPAAPSAQDRRVAAQAAAMEQQAQAELSREPDHSSDPARPSRNSAETASGGALRCEICQAGHSAQDHVDSVSRMLENAYQTPGATPPETANLIDQAV